MSDSTEHKRQSPHDRFIRGIAKYKEVLRDLPQLLTSGVTDRLALGSVKLEPGSYVDEHLVSGYPDLLFSCQFACRKGFLYFLFEHQSKPDRTMAFRIADYALQITKDWRKQNAGAKYFPAVVPVVLYQSKRPWRGPTEYHDLLDVDSDLKAELRTVLFSSGFILIALKEVDVEKIRCGILLKLSLGLIKRWLLENKLAGWSGMRNGWISCFRCAMDCLRCE